MSRSVIIIDHPSDYASKNTNWHQEKSQTEGENIQGSSPSGEQDCHTDQRGGDDEDEEKMVGMLNVHIAFLFQNLHF